MFPDLNVEDLGKGGTLLLLLHSRGHHLPEVFANVDFDPMHLGLTSGITRYGLMPRHTMFLTRQRTLKTYDKVISLEETKNDGAPELRHAISIAPGEGLLVLEA